MVRGFVNHEIQPDFRHPDRRLEDNMTLGFEVPGEDEIATWSAK
jgi:hypothetical protein